MQRLPQGNVGYGDEAPSGGAPSGALVLARDNARVREEFTARSSVLGKAHGQRVRLDGFAAGRRAGRFADIGTGAVGGSRPALDHP